MRDEESTAVRTFVCSLLALTALACGDDATTADASTDALVDGATVTPPDIPWLGEGAPPVVHPTLTPCPEGWRESSDPDDIATCEPYPESGRADCPFGEAHFPGEPGCRPVGDACPAGEWPSDLPADASVVYVNAAAPAGGDGSLDSPFDTLASVAWSSLEAGTTVALAKGTYGGTLPLKAGISVVGACTAETILSGIDAPVRAVVTVTSNGEPATLRNVAIVNPPQAGVAVESARSLALFGVVISGALAAAASVAGSGSLIEVEDALIEETVGDSAGNGRAVFARGGGRFDGQRIVALHNREIAFVAAGEDTIIVLSDAAVHDTVPALAGNAGTALGAADFGRIEASRFVATQHHSAATAAFDDGALVLSDAVIRDVVGRARDGEGGSGVMLQRGGRLEADRLHVARATYTGIAAVEGASATLDDVIIAETRGSSDDFMSGRGLRLVDGSNVEATRLAVLRNFGTGIIAAFPDTTLSLTDAIVHRNAIEADDAFNRGVDVQDGATLTAERVVFSENRHLGLLVIGPGATATLRDSLLIRSSANGDGTGGHGIAVQEGGHLEAERAVVSDMREVGIIAMDEGTAVLRDTVVRDVLPSVGSGFFGMGISAQTGSVTAERVLVDGAHELGIIAFTGGAFEGTDVAVGRTMRSGCDCPDRIFGYGAATIAADLRLTRFAVSDSATCGLFISRVNLHPEPALDVVDGIVEGSPIGACVQVEGYDLDRIRTDVLYRNNDVNLDITALPVPEALGGVAP